MSSFAAVKEQKRPVGALRPGLAMLPLSSLAELFRQAEAVAMRARSHG